MGKSQKAIIENIDIDLSTYHVCSQLVLMEDVIAVQCIDLVRNQDKKKTCFMYFTSHGLYFLDGPTMLEVIPYQNIDSITLDKSSECFDMTFEALDGLDRMITVHFPIPELLIKSIYNTSHLNGLKQFAFSTK